MRILFFAFVSFFLLSCKSKSEDVKAFIPGIYIRHFEGLYSTGNDTLYITNTDNYNAYLIIRKSVFQRLQNNQLQQPERVVENWSAVYNPRDKILYEQKRERLLSFKPDSNKLFVGGSAYLKIK